MGVLRAAANLSEVPLLPPDRCHELDGKRKGHFAVDLIHPYRLTFIPDHTPVPVLPDGGIDKKNVVRIKILNVENYHK